MRATTELTTRFNLTMNLIGSKELDAFLNNDDEPGSIEYWEAFDRAEIARMNGEDGLLDALDFDTVPFETVETELSLELFEQDAADDRAQSHTDCFCKKCGFEDEWEDGLLTYIAGEFRCANCMPAPQEIIIMRELHEKRRMRDQKARIARANKFCAALETAKRMRPDLNWAKYEHDARRYAY
jgi:hypothetical protein